MTTDPNAQIIFFDGMCGLCNTFVDFVLPRDTGERFLFSPLQGTTAARLLPAEFCKNLSTIVLYDAGTIYLRSDAVLRIMGQMGGVWSLAPWLLVLPQRVRDWLYRFIAARRYQWFGKKDSCRLPTAAERSRFLD